MDPGECGFERAVSQITGTVDFHCLVEKNLYRNYVVKLPRDHKEIDICIETIYKSLL